MGRSGSEQSKTRTATFSRRPDAARLGGGGFAETRWVLWYQDVVVVEGQEPAVVWSQSGSSTTKPDCEAQRRKEIGRYEQMSKLFPNDWAKRGDTIIVKRQGKVVRRTSYYCYPNTINPRWEHLRE